MQSLMSLREAFTQKKERTKVVEKRKVFIRVVFLKIGEIDTTKECFTADVHVEAKWREPNYDKKTDLDPKSLHWDSVWLPRLYADNALGEPKEAINRTVLFNRELEAFVCERRRIKGTFVETMELYQFPFDIQDISISLTSELPANEVELEVDRSEESSINKGSFADEQEWRLYSTVHTEKEECCKFYESGSKDLHSVLSFRCTAARRVGFYAWNICFVMFVICAMTFTTFAVDYKLTQNRLQLTFILLLTTVTFKFVVNQALPRISYLTYLDKYVIASMVMLIVICIWHALVYAAIGASGIPPETVFWTDKWVLISLAIAYVLINIIFIIVLFTGVLKKRRAIEAIEKRK